MSLSPVEVGAYIASGVLAASKLISACQGLWAKLPRPVAVVMPVLVAALPQVAAAAGLIKVEGDLIVFGITAAALLLPGIAEAEQAAPKTS